MAEYIERKALDKALTVAAANDKDKNRRTWAKAICVLHDLPAADVAPVVRCKECKHCRELNRKDRIEEAYADGVLWCTNQSDGVWPDDFCSYGERKEAQSDAQTD